MILRRWTGRIRTADEAAYRDYIAGTGGAAYLSTPGNLGWQMIFRDLGDGSSEVQTLSWWADLDVIRGFAGEDYERAVYYPEDDRFLLDRSATVDHFRVVKSAGST